MKDIKLRALVIDDNEVNTLILANMLELFGIRSDQVYSGEDAVKMYQRADYDLAFVDHIMPDMDGLQTTEKLRSLNKIKNSTAIFALTSYVTDKIKNEYRVKGANDVFLKPLGLAEVTSILREWFPELPVDEVSYLKETSPYYFEKKVLIKTLLKDIPEINYEEGLKYAIGNPIQYAHILKVSIKDIRESINRIIKSSKQENRYDLQIGIHNLKSLFFNIGAIELFEDTRDIYNLISQEEYEDLKFHLPEYIIKIDSFNFRLENVIHEYEAMEPAAENEQEKEQLVMPEQEYEQCLLNTIYYIKSFEYNSIIKELQNLISSSQSDLKNEFIKVLEEIKDFDYDSALERILKIKEKR